MKIMKINRSWILALAGTICCAMGAHAGLTPVATTGSWDGEPYPGTLNTVMQSLTGNSGYNVNSAANRVDDSSDQVWTGTGGNGTATMLLTIAGYASYSSFGIYNLSDPSQKTQIFGGGTSPSSTVSITVPVGDFGFYLDTPGGVWYSVNSQNSDGGDHMVTLTTTTDQSLNLDAANLEGWGHSGGTVAWDPGSYILGWEDLTAIPGSGTDVDYQDMIVEVSGVAPIPEPTTMVAGAMMLLPFATQGLRALRRKRTA